MTSKKTARRWVCPICGWENSSPLPVVEVSHRCPARDRARRFLRAVS